MQRKIVHEVPSGDPFSLFFGKKGVSVVLLAQSTKVVHDDTDEELESEEEQTDHRNEEVDRTFQGRLSHGSLSLLCTRSVAVEHEKEKQRGREREASHYLRKVRTLVMS
jgi:hypothetical protein